MDKKNVTKERIDFLENVFKLRKELDKESDRGCILMATSFLDYELQNVFEYYLFGSKRMLDEMFSGQGSLATFSSRIKLAYSLGFISKTTMEDLNIIRRIRNNCGHNYESVSFQDEPIKRPIYSLKSSLYAGNTMINPRKLFINNTYVLLNEIQARKAELTKVNELTTKYGVPDLSLDKLEGLALRHLEMTKEYLGENATKDQMIDYLKKLSFDAFKILDERTE